MKLKILLVLLTASHIAIAQTSATEWNVAKPGVKEVQIPLLRDNFWMP
jgi:hypothetical protein